MTPRLLAACSNCSQLRSATGMPSFRRSARLEDSGRPGSSTREKPSVGGVLAADGCPEPNDGRPYESLGDQPMPPFGDISYATGACTTCDDENPLRSYRVVARFDAVVYVLYSWGCNSSSNFDVVMYLANKLPRRLGLDYNPAWPARFFQAVDPVAVLSP